MAIDFQPDSNKIDFKLDFQPDQEDLVSQIPGMGPAPAPYVDDSSILDKARGAVEAGVVAATGGPASIIGGLAGMFSGGDLENRNKVAGKVMDELTYHPRTEKGQEYGEAVGEFANRYLNPLLGGVGGIHMPGERAKDVPLKPLEKVKEPVKVDFKPIEDIKQQELFDLNEQPKGANPYEAQAGYWTVDENGMPIRADLSMEAQNLQQPLQRNLWGDELPARENPVGQSAHLPMDRDIMGFEKMSEDPRKLMENDLGITQAIDKMPDTPWRSERDTAIDLLKGELPADGPMKTAMMDAEITTPRSALTDPTIRVPKSQRGGVNLQALIDETPRLKDLFYKLVRNEKLASEEAAVVRALRKEEFLGFDNAKQAIKALVEGHGDWEISPSTKGAMTKLSRQRGAINPEVFKEGFQKLKQLADGTWLRAHNDGTMFHIEAIKDGHKLGHVEFSPEYVDRLNSDERNLKSYSTVVKPEHRGKGYAEQMYRFAADLGNDIQRSDSQTPDGRAMWDGFHEKGMAQKGVIRSLGNKQRGALWLGDSARKQMEKVGIKDNTFIPENPDPKAVITAARGQKDGSPHILQESGAISAAMKRGSVAIQAAGHIVQNASKRADLWIRRNVLPAEASLRKLSSRDLMDMKDLIIREFSEGDKFDRTQLEMMPEKKIRAYMRMREMFDQSLKTQNEARAIRNLPPITAKEAYFSSRWEGDFRRPIYQAVLDKNGNPKFNERGELEKKLVWYLADHTRAGLERQTKALIKDHPDFGFDKKWDHIVRHYKRETDLQSDYSTLLDILGRDDPAVQKLQQFIEDQATGQGASFLNQEKHHKSKAGIRGFVGDRPNTNRVPIFSEYRHGKNEALAFFEQQIAYAKNSSRWSEMQKGADALKEILADKDLNAEQPNNLKYVREYYKNQLGYGEAKAIAGLEDGLRDMGWASFSPTLANKYLGGMKSFFIMQKLAVSVGYTLANMIQYSQVVPYTMDIAKKFGGNPITALPIGIFGGIAMATGHYANFLAKGKLEAKTPEGFFARAFKYAEDNGVTARSIYDESPVSTSFSATGRIGNAAGFTMAVPEAFVRASAFMTYAWQLKESGKFAKDIDAFQAAEDYVNMSMVDYRAGERPMVFAKLGTIGNFLNTLQTYPMNFYNQWSYFAREAGKGNIMPFAAALGVQMAVAGAMGVPYVEDLDKLYMWVKNKMPAEQWAKVQGSDFWADPKMWMVKNFGQSSVYGVLSDKSGIGMTSRVAAPGLNQMIQAPGGPIVEIAKQAGNVADAALNPTNKTKVLQAVHSVTPAGLQGALETSPIMEGTAYNKKPDGSVVVNSTTDFSKHTAVATRSPEEQKMRAFGLRSQREVLEREANYRAFQNIKAGQEKAKELPDRIYDAAKRGDKAEVGELIKMYSVLTGQEFSNEMFENQIKQDYMTNIQRASTGRTTALALQELARARATMQSVYGDQK